MERGERGLFKPGMSGNPNGRPQGARSRFSEAFLKDIADVWQEEGLTALRKTATCDPATFVRVCSSMIPRDVQMTLQARLPGGLDGDDWAIAMAVFAAVREAFPDAGKRQPGEVLEYVLSALRAHTAPQIEGVAETASDSDR